MQMKAWTIGGDPDCDILVDEDTVSGHHCRLTRQPDGFYYLEDRAKLANLTRLRWARRLYYHGPANREKLNRARLPKHRQATPPQVDGRRR